MFEIDMQSIEEVGEFGSEEWCDACAACGVKMLQAVDLPASLSWSFTERYTHAPNRLVSEKWPQSGYHFMIQNVVVSGAGHVPQAALEIPGFHVSLAWAYICNQSRSKYGGAGQKQRSLEEQTLKNQIGEYLGTTPDLGDVVQNADWPASVVTALTAGGEDAGLHNIAASMQRVSPEFKNLPCTDLGVPVFTKMTEDQKRDFIVLCGINPLDS